MPLPATQRFRLLRLAGLRRPAQVAVLAGLLAAGLSLLLPDQYRSEARILADTGHSGGNGTRTGVWAPTAAPESNASREDGPTIIYVDILRSRRLAEQLLLGEYDYRCRAWRFGPERPVRGTLLDYLGARSLDRGLGPLRSLLAVQRDLKSGQLTLSAETRAPALSQQVVRRAVAGLRDTLVELSQAAGVQRARFTEDRLREVQARYQALSQGFEDFQEGNHDWETSPAPRVRFRGQQLKAETDLWRQVVANLTLNHEQALLEAQNDTQTLLLLDPGHLPVEKSKPARSLMVFAAMCAAGAGTWVYRNRTSIAGGSAGKELSS
jgi:uncharacterized protein involved in exopolysaccharide biosynthesis